jgi:hypothetical protein
LNDLGVGGCQQEPLLYLPEQQRIDVTVSVLADPASVHASIEFTHPFIKMPPMRGYWTAMRNVRKPFRNDREPVFSFQSKQKS